MSRPISNSPRHRASKRRIATRTIGRQRAVAGPIADEETLCLNYSHDCAACDCPAERSFSSIPVLAVARSPLVDRCVTCGTTWSRRERRDQPTAILSRPVLEGAA